MFRVVHFEISANDPEKMVAFYKNVFGWDIKKWDGPQAYWMVTTGKDGDGVNGGIFQPGEIFNGTVNTIEVPDIDEYCEKITSNGGQIVVEKMVIQSVGYMAYCKDIEGTIFGICQFDSNVG